MDEELVQANKTGDPINIKRKYNNFTSTLARLSSDFPRAREIG